MCPSCVQLSRRFLGSVKTNASGVYTKTGLASGTYYLKTTNSLGYIDEVHSDLPCLGNQCPTVTTGSGVSVTAGATTNGIDFALAVGGSSRDGHGGCHWCALANVSSTRTLERELCGQRETNASGVFAKTGLAPGTYFLQTSTASDTSTGSTAT